MESWTSAADTAQRWGLILKSSPYPVFPNPKERYSIDWKDEDGAFEYGTVQYLDSVDFSVDFLLITKDRNSLTSQRQIRQAISRFVGEIRTEYFSVYDSYTGVGLQKVRYVGFTQSNYWYDGHRTGYIFSVQMRCDDPTTRMMLSSGVIVTYSSSITLPLAFYPIVNGYKPFYIQATTGASATDTRATWGLTAKVEPTPAMANGKEPFRENDPQSNGNIGFATVMLGALDFKVDFFIKTYASAAMTAEDILLTRILDFRSFLTSNRLMVYDSYTDFGRTDVQYQGGSVESFTAWNNSAWAILSVSFRANDSTTNVVYSNGALVAERYAGLNDVNGINLYSNDPSRLRAKY